MATIEDRMAKAFGLEGDAWERHAHPWSVYTRIPIPALLAAAIWSRTWIGRRSLVPVGAVCVWAAVNQKVFPRPRTFDHWASKAVLGERVWANRTEVPVPERHRVAPHVLTGLNALGVPFVVRGLVVLDPWLVLFGLAVHMAGKNWFLDRMALLYDDATPRTLRPDRDRPALGSVVRVSPAADLAPPRYSSVSSGHPAAVEAPRGVTEQ